jgi:hypothetical protein
MRKTIFWLFNLSSRTFFTIYFHTKASLILFGATFTLASCFFELKGFA